MDTIPPDLTVPADITVLATDSSGAVVTFAVSATDAVGVTTGPSCLPASGDLFPIGANLVICQASDISGNTGTASFTVTVLGGRSLIQAAADAIAPHAGDNKRFRNALKDLDKALELNLWTDEVHPDPKHGHKVFDRAASALKDLLKLADDDDDGKKGKSLTDVQRAALDTATDNLLVAARILASTAISDAEAGTTLDPKRQGKVDKELARAQAEFDKAEAASDPDDAIKHFGKSWQHALNAIKHQNK